MKLIHAALGFAVLVQLSSLAFGTEKSPAKSADIPHQVLQQVDLGGGEELQLMLAELPPQFSAIEHTHPVARVCYDIESTADPSMKAKR